MLLSRTFPEMSAKEVDDFIRLKGNHHVTYFDEKLKSLVGCRYMSVNAFFEYNGIEKTDDEYAAVTSDLYSNGSHSRVVNDHTVSISLN